MKKIKKNLYIICAVAFLVIAIAVSVTVVALNIKVSAASQTAIGHIYIGNAQGAEREKIIVDAYNQWKKDTENSGGYKIVYQNETLVFQPYEYLEVNVEATMRNIKDGSKDNRIILKPKSGEDSKELSTLEQDIRNLANGFICNFGDSSNFREDESKLWGAVFARIGGLYTTADIDLYKYVLNTKKTTVGENYGFSYSYKNDLALSVELDVTGYEADAEKIVKALPDLSFKLDDAEEQNFKGIKIDANEADGFSLLNYYNQKQNDYKLNSKQLSILGTGLTAVAMRSNFTNIRRKDDIDNVNAAYAYKDIDVVTKDSVEITENPYGIATKVSNENNYDLTFYNDESFDYNVAVKYLSDSKKLVFILIGPKFVKNHKIESEIETIEPTTTWTGSEVSFSTAEEKNNKISNITSDGYKKTSDVAIIEKICLDERIEEADYDFYVREIKGEPGAIIQYYKIIEYYVNGVLQSDKQKAFKIVSYGASANTFEYIAIAKAVKE